MYAVGVDCVCGVWDQTAANTAATQNTFRLLTDPATNGGTNDENGSSQAAAQTAGIIANMVSDPAIRAQLVAGGLSNFAMAVKTRMLQIAATNKGTAFPDGFPRLSNGIAIDCPGVANQGAPIPPPPNRAPLFQTALIPTFQEVASGLTVTFPNPVSFYSSTTTLLMIYLSRLSPFLPSPALLAGIIENHIASLSLSFSTDQMAFSPSATIRR